MFRQEFGGAPQNLNVHKALFALGQGHLEEAGQLIQGGFHKNPQDLGWMRCLMELKSRQGAFQEALQIAKELIDRQSGQGDPGLWHTVARLHISLGQFQEGLIIFDQLRPYGLFGDAPIKTPAPLWQGQNLAGKTICLATEGGVGDVVCFVRFARELSDLGAKVVVATYPPLFQLLKTVPGVDFLIDREATDRVFFDYWAPALSLPRLLKLNAEDIGGNPYMTVDPILKQKWRYLVSDPRPRVGLCWQGRKEFVEDHLRSIRASAVEHLLNISSVAWYKVQLFEGDNSLVHPDLIDLTAHIGCPSQLSAMISALDLLICVDSGPAHIAGAIGTPVWLLNRFFGWITFSCPNPHAIGSHEFYDQSLWYDSMQIFTQTVFGSWQEPLQAVEHHLKSMAFDFKEHE